MLTYQIIGRYNNTAKKHDGRGDSVVRPEDHIVDDGLVDQVSHLDEAGDRRHQAEHCHFRSICKREEETPLSSSPATIGCLDTQPLFHNRFKRLHFKIYLIEHFLFRHE